MEISQMAIAFDIYYNNITSNQAPGLNDYERSLFLTRAEHEIVKNYANISSKGNGTGQGFDNSAKRQIDFSTLTKVGTGTIQENPTCVQLDPRSYVFLLPKDVFVITNETLKTKNGKLLQVVPLQHEEYTQQMSQTFKRPLKHQAWRLINNAETDGIDKNIYVELVTNEGDCPCSYRVRYLRVPRPIITDDLPDDLTIYGESKRSSYCEVDPNLHEDIVQRAVELAKMAWEGNLSATTQLGQRSE